MAFAPWNVLAMGKIRSDAEEKRRLESGEGGRVLFGDWKRTETERKVCLGLEKVAEEVGAKNIVSGTEECVITSLFYLTASYDQSLSFKPCKRHRMCSPLLVGERSNICTTI